MDIVALQVPFVSAGKRVIEPKGVEIGGCRLMLMSAGCGFRGLTFELSGRQRQDARPGLAKMYRVLPDRAWWPAVGAPLERGVRHPCGALAMQFAVSVPDRRPERTF